MSLRQNSLLIFYFLVKNSITSVELFITLSFQMSAGNKQKTISSDILADKQMNAIADKQMNAEGVNFLSM